MVLSEINQRIIPPYLVANESWAVWVDGYTSDNPGEWALMMGFITYNGKIAPGTVTGIKPELIWRGTPWEHKLPTYLEVRELAKMIGNVQRSLRGIPAVA